MCRRAVSARAVSARAVSARAVSVSAVSARVVSACVVSARVQCGAVAARDLTTRCGAARPCVPRRRLGGAGSPRPQQSSSRLERSMERARDAIAPGRGPTGGASAMPALAQARCVSNAGTRTGSGWPHARQSHFAPHAATVLADREASSQQPRRRRGRKQRGLCTTGCRGMLLDLVTVSDSWSTRKQAVLGAAKQTEAESV